MVKIGRCESLNDIDCMIDRMLFTMRYDSFLIHALEYSRHEDEDEGRKGRDDGGKRKE
jgi:hypothetical protein